VIPIGADQPASKPAETEKTNMRRLAEKIRDRSGPSVGTKTLNHEYKSLVANGERNREVMLFWDVLMELRWNGRG